MGNIVPERLIWRTLPLWRRRGRDCLCGERGDPDNKNFLLGLD